VPTPQDPEDEPLGDELPDGVADSAPDDASREAALWRSIIDNYGERPQLDDDLGTARPPAEAEPPPRGLPDPTFDDVEEPELAPAPEEHYVPPAPPPLPKPTPARLLAWLGLFGVPVIVLVALVANIVVPPWLGLLLMAWFVGGFVYLVASMRPGSGGDYDDGARL
jgi:hypothetical protein